MLFVDPEISILLKEYGLDDKEISVYIDLVANKELTAYRLAKNVKIHRSTAYDVLERLAVKGFVSKVTTSEVLYYQANDMSRIIAKLKDRETILLSLTPKIEAIEKNIFSEFEIYSDVDGQKQFNFSLSNLAKDDKLSFAYFIGNTYASSISSNIFTQRLVKEFSNRKNNHKKIDYKGIWDVRFRNDKILSLYNGLGSNKFMEHIPSKCGTLVCDTMVAFLYTADKPYVVVVRNKIIAGEFKAYFEHLWSIAKK